MSTTTHILATWTAGAANLGAREVPALVRPEPTPMISGAEELANCLTHGLGLAWSLAGLYGLAQLAVGSVATAETVGCWAYGVTLVMAYASSTLYHGWAPGRVKRALLLADHVAIYGLIAGTFTPLAMTSVTGREGWGPLALIWGLALAGGVAKVARLHALDRDSALPYVALATAAIAVLKDLMVEFPSGRAAWFAAGVAFYLAGVAFFVRKDRPFNHMIWHLFVMAGSVCHYRVVIGHVSHLAS